MRTRAGIRDCCLAVAALGLTGCFDLALPNVPADGGPGPQLTILSPRQGQTISLSAPVEIQADSVNGVSSVTVTCGGAPGTGVYTWNVPPYSGLVDFTRCTILAGGGDGGSGLGTLPLTFIGVDRLGQASSTTFNVLLDATTAGLSANLPSRVLPRTPFSLTVASDRPLQLPPTVRLAGTEANRIIQLQGGDGGQLYRVDFSTTPGLGIDDYQGDPYSPPIEVLLDTERSVSLTVDARATNNNPAHLEQAVLLSRVLWDRAVPGRIALAASRPATSDAGVQLALATVDTNPTATSTWLPGLFRAGDGTFVPFDATAVQLAGGDGGFSLDAGWSAQGIDARGRTLFVRDAGTGADLVFVSAPPEGGTVRPAAGYSVTFQVPRPLTRVDDLLCPPDIVTGQPSTFTCPTTATQTLRCLSATQGVLTTTGSSASIGASRAGGVAGTAGPARGYLSPNDQTGCGQAWTVGTVGSGAFTFQSRLDPNGTARGCNFQQVLRLIPVPDGTFVVQMSSLCLNGSTPDFPILRVSAAGVIQGAYIQGLGAAAPVQWQVLGALADGSIVTMRNSPPLTVFESWQMGATAPAATAYVPGLFLYSPIDPRLPDGVVASSDGTLSLLLNSATLGDVVVNFGQGLKPAWIYRYPRIANGSTLAGDDARHQVYYVDAFNNDVVAIKPAVAGAAGCVSQQNALAVTTPSAYACHDKYGATLVVTNAGCTPLAIQGVAVGATVTSGPCTPPTPGTYTPTVTSIGPGQSATVLDLQSGAFCCSSPGCPSNYACTEHYTFTVTTSAGTLTSSQDVALNLQGCTEICPAGRRPRAAGVHRDRSPSARPPAPSRVGSPRAATVGTGPGR